LASAVAVGLAAAIAIAVSPTEGDAGISYFTTVIVIAGIWLLGDAARQRATGLPETWAATGVLLAYAAAFTAIAYWRFASRDVLGHS
jgi:ABC-type transport system involved in multi-copper enzyme maturation permease subunit